MTQTATVSTSSKILTDAKLTALNIVKQYKSVMLEGLASQFPYLNLNELNEAIEWAVLNNYCDHDGSINNNYSNQTINGTMIDILHYIQRLEPIITSSGVLYKKHKEADNPLSRMIMGFLKQRSEYKTEMKHHDKGTPEYEKYNLLQLLEKLNANATYGALGLCTCFYYNIYVAESVTRQGRSYISASIMLFESFLANNVKFNSLNEVMIFIHNVVGERHERRYKDKRILDSNITRQECFFKIMNGVDPLIWIPTQDEMMLVWNRICTLSQEDINRIFYKNNLYSFCDNELITGMLIKILSKLNRPFMTPNKVPKEIKNDLDELTGIVKEYVYYHHQYIDKLDRVEYMQRDVVAVSDTDSCIISFDAWYHYLLDKVYNLDLKVKRERFNMVDLIEYDEWGDAPKRIMVEEVEPMLDYDFYTDKVIELHRRAFPAELIPQDSLCYSIVNIMAYICSNLVIDYLDRYCSAAGSNQKGIPCYLVMKNEFYFPIILLTDNIRNYADVQTIQEGRLIPDSQSTRLAVMGLPINKSTLPDRIRTRLQDILYEDIMTAGNINQVVIMKHLILLEKEIIANIMAKKTDYYKPDNIAAMRSYEKNPMSVNGIAASVVYNELRTEDMPAINLEERNKIYKVKTNINRNNVGKIREKYPEIYNKLMRLLDDPILSGKLGTIAFPAGSEVPDWILEFVDVATIVNDNLKNFPLESVGLRRLGNDAVNYSNVITL